MLFYGLPDRRASHCAEPQARVSGRLCVPGSTSIPVMPGISFVTSLVPQKFFPLHMPCGSSPLLCFFPAQAFDRDLIHLSADRQRKRRCSKPTHDLQVGSGAEHDASHHRCAASRRCFSPFPRTPTHNACGIFATKEHRKPKFSMLFGAGGVTRTHDLLITNQLLYRLSYTSVVLSNCRGSIQTQDEFYHKVLCASSNFLWFSFGDHEFFPRPPH